MDRSVRANAVDTLLARLDGAVAPIWLTLLLRLDARPEPAALRRALRALVRETPRLQLRWQDPGRRWSPCPRDDAEVDAALIVDDVPTADADAVDRVINTRIDLARDLPLRLHLIRMHDPAGGPWLLAIALHHAIGDARALGPLLERLWQLHAGRGGAAPAGRPMRDVAVLGAALRRPLAVLRLAVPKYRLLAPRAVALARSGDDVGPTMLASVHFDLSPGTSTPPAAIFLAAVLAAAARHAARDGVVRLRVPVDLRGALGLGRALGNGCSAVALEFTRAELLALDADPPALARRARDRLAALVRAGAQWTTALECIALACVPAALLRRGAAPGLRASPRTNTLVVTYLGDLDRHFVGCPLAIRSARTHTATWGVTGFSLAGKLSLNVGAFAGLWRRDELERFINDLSHWTATGFGLTAERSPA